MNSLEEIAVVNGNIGGYLICAAPWYDYEKIEPDWNRYELIECIWFLKGKLFPASYGSCIMSRDNFPGSVNIKLWRPVIVKEAGSGLGELK